jgi:hypothetical protein
MQIFEDDERGTVFAELYERVAHRIEQTHARELRFEIGRLPEAWSELANLRNERRKRGRADAEFRNAQIRQRAAQRARYRLKRLAFVGARKARGYARALTLGGGHEFLEQSRLPDAGLAADERKAHLSAPRPA